MAFAWQGHRQWRHLPLLNNAAARFSGNGLVGVLVHLARILHEYQCCQLMVATPCAHAERGVFAMHQ
jgi:hypothetical protein